MKKFKFKQFKIGDAFIHGCQLFVKTSPRMAQEAGILMRGEKKRFKPEDEVEAIKKISFVGSGGSSLKAG